MNSISKYLLETDQLDTFEAYHLGYFRMVDRIIVPYIGVGLIKHPSFAPKEKLFIDKAYIVLDGVTKVLETKTFSSLLESPRFVLGGIELADGSFEEIGIWCKDALIYIPRSSIVSENVWAIEKHEWLPVVPRTEALKFLRTFPELE